MTYPDGDELKERGGNEHEPGLQPSKVRVSMYVDAANFRQVLRNRSNAWIQHFTKKKQYRWVRDNGKRTTE